MVASQHVSRHVSSNTSKHVTSVVFSPPKLASKSPATPTRFVPPDIAFVRRERIEEVGEVEGYWPGAPDLAVEVVSPNDSYTGVEEKVAAWLRAGTRTVVVVEPRTRTLTVRSSRTEIRVLTEGEVLDVGEIVPAWTLPVADVFG